MAPSGTEGAKMIESYLANFQQFGVSPESLGWLKGRQEVRFQALTEGVRQHSRILDFGSGFGDLFGYLRKSDLSFDYHGVDVVAEFVEASRNRFPEASFDHISLGQRLEGEFDIAVASGVFNFLYTDSAVEHEELVFSTMSRLFEVVSERVSVDFMSPSVDYRQADAYHQRLDSLLDFVTSNLSRNLHIDHSYLPYEYCVHIFKSKN